MAILPFADAIGEATAKYGKPHLLLGNGFSIACRPDIFLYGKLYEQADFKKLSPYVQDVFNALGTQDFEKVIRALRAARLLLQAYKDLGVSQGLLDQLQADADGLRELLVQTIAASHPERPSDLDETEYQACRAFLSFFATVYTFNYDLLLYWTQMHTEEGVKPVSDDGFRAADDPDATYVTWEPTNTFKQNMWFLHGALHVFDAGTEIQKYTWLKTGVRLITQIREALDKGLFPLFVSEGTSKEKLQKIRHSDYLNRGYISFSRIGGCLFIFGHSLAESDNHYLTRIEKGKVAHVYIGLHGDPNSESNKWIVARAEKMSAARQGRSPLVVSYFDTASATVWG